MNNYKTILALDLGTVTGWALQNKNNNIISGTENFKTNSFEGGGMVFLRFKKWLVDLKNSEGGFDEIYFEQVRSHKGVEAAHKYGGFLAHLTAFCEHHQIAYKGVPVGTIKKHITGKGNATKYAVIDAVKSKGFSPKDDNEADSLALLHCVLAKYNRGEL
ncbi:crossover junction endodeoxyribonuclease RuvC [Rickettsia endosymbiont of Orchestes rusci]|uniref:crossover junction endodeoxyribonuclease RuvC n=1 Tax=Rickettsia endosymbiont of Orchestes rusci TaxID=3066250 RepID=UPI00313B2B10